MDPNTTGFSIYLSIGALLVSILTSSISIFSLLHQRRALFVNTVSKKRLDYMERLTNLLNEFIDAYYNRDIDLATRISYKLQLNFSPLNYVHLDEAQLLKDCIDSLKDKAKGNIEELIANSQILFKHEWEQIKIESLSRKFQKNKIIDKTRDTAERTI